MADEVEDGEAHAVEGGLIQHLSVSQVTTFDPSQDGGCNRKWYFDKVLRIHSPSTKSQEMGTQVHAQLEHYLTTGDDVLGPIARAGMRFLPKPREWVVIEHDIFKSSNPLTACGIKFRGRIDVLNESGEYIDDEGTTHDDPETLEVVDWKTTSSLDWAKNPAQLARTVQMVGYAEYVRRRPWGWPLRRVRVSHGYFVTKGAPAARKVTATIEVETVKQKWQEIEETVIPKMVQVAQATRVEDVRPTWSSCKAFRGCFYQDRCPRAGHAAVSMFEGGDGMSLLAKMQKINQAPAETTAPTAPAPDPVAVAAAKAELAAAAVNPPDAAPSTPPGNAEPVPPEVMAALPPSVQAAAMAHAATVPPVEAEAPKAKRGRPKKVAETPVELNPPGVMPLSAVGLSDDITAEPQDRALYVDVVITGFETKPLEPYVSDILRKMEETFSTPDVRCAPESGPLGYSKWKGVLAAAVRAQPPGPGVWTLTDVRESEVKQIVAEELRGICNVYVRGR